MKRNILLLLLFTLSLRVTAQPGDYGLQARRFEELSKKLEADPDNYKLIWERIQTSRFDHTAFSMYTKSMPLKTGAFYFNNPAELLEGLNKLIDNNVVIDRHNIAEFKLLRGLYYYFSGELNKALKDYLSALNYNPSTYTRDLKDNLYISLAAYYYNREKNLTKQNARQALKYVEMANPGGCFSNETPDCYEQEKVALLKFLKEEQRLIAYYKSLVLAEYAGWTQTRTVGFETTNDIFDRNNYYFRTLERINDLAEYYGEIKDSKQSKYLNEQLAKYLPPDSSGQAYKTYPKEKMYNIVSEEYSKRFFNLHHKDQYKKLSWDYRDLSALIERVQQE